MTTAELIAQAAAAHVEAWIDFSADLHMPFARAEASAATHTAHWAATVAAAEAGYELPLVPADAASVLLMLANARDVLNHSVCLRLRRCT